MTETIKMSDPSSFQKIFPNNVNYSLRLYQVFLDLFDLYSAPNVISAAQSEFYNLVVGYITRETNPTIIGIFLDNLLKVIYEHPLEFSPLYAYRGFNELSISNIQRIEWEAILKVLIDTANPTTRSLVVKNINWNNVKARLNPITAENIIGKLHNYYNVM